MKNVNKLIGFFVVSLSLGQAFADFGSAGVGSVGSAGGSLSSCGQIEQNFNVIVKAKDQVLVNGLQTEAIVTNLAILGIDASSLRSSQEALHVLESKATVLRAAYKKQGCTNAK